VGAGRTELVRAILGIDVRSGGTVEIEGTTIPAKYSAMLHGGVGFLPEERKTQAIFTTLPLFHNLTIRNLKDISRVGLINHALERKTTRSYLEELNIKASYNQLLLYLSGGTQQKIALAKWLYAGSKVLILDEPTKGIDVAGRFDIYQILRNLANKGLAILVVSSDVEEVGRISDRILIMREGKIVTEIDKKMFSEELVLSNAIGAKTDGV
jgi:ribose transport system ATP-binding protein